MQAYASPLVGFTHAHRPICPKSSTQSSGSYDYGSGGAPHPTLLAQLFGSKRCDVARQPKVNELPAHALHQGCHGIRERVVQLLRAEGRTQVYSLQMACAACYFHAARA
jgi:hypothetical protein